MRTVNTEFVITQANAGTSKIHKAVKDAIEVGVVVPSILRKNLEDAGLTIVDDEARLSEYGFASMKHLKRVQVWDKTGHLIAMGAAGDFAEALLHAMLGYFRENLVPGTEQAPESVFVPTEGAPVQ